MSAYCVLDDEYTGNEHDASRDCTSVRILDTLPPVYEVLEPPLTEEEEERIKWLKEKLYESIDAKIADIEDPASYLEQKVSALLKSSDALEHIMYYIRRDMIGYGKLDVILNDKNVEDVSVDGPQIPVYVYHNSYGSLMTNVSFGKEELDSMVYRLSQQAGKHISLANPLLDASLPSGDRLQMTIGDEVTTRGSTITIRRFRRVPMNPIDLINYSTFSVEMMTYLWMAVENGSNILVAGGTASGKTSVLNAIAMFIPQGSKIVSIEDTREINLTYDNWIPAVTREVEEGGHSIDMFHLLKEALRQRPEYILVGEVRGREAYTLFQAMATGHITFSTIHADSVDTVVRRLTKPPIDIPLMLLDSLDILCIQKIVKLGKKRVRRCIQISEVKEVDFEDEMLDTTDLFKWRRPDVFEFGGESEVFIDTMDKLGLEEGEILDEFMSRRRVLEWLRVKSGFVDVQRTLFEYNQDKEGLMERMEQDEARSRCLH